MDNKVNNKKNIHLKIVQFWNLSYLLCLVTENEKTCQWKRSQTLMKKIITELCLNVIAQLTSYLSRLGSVFEQLKDMG
jgi:hypothetical protein